MTPMTTATAGLSRTGPAIGTPIMVAIILTNIEPSSHGSGTVNQSKTNPEMVPIKSAKPIFVRRASSQLLVVF